MVDSISTSAVDYSYLLENYTDISQDDNYFDEIFEECQRESEKTDSIQNNETTYSSSSIESSLSLSEIYLEQILQSGISTESDEDEENSAKQESVTAKLNEELQNSIAQGGTKGLNESEETSNSSDDSTISTLDSLEEASEDMLSSVLEKLMLNTLDKMQDNIEKSLDEQKDTEQMPDGYYSADISSYDIASGDNQSFMTNLIVQNYGIA